MQVKSKCKFKVTKKKKKREYNLPPKIIWEGKYNSKKEKEKKSLKRLYRWHVRHPLLTAP